MVKLLTAVSFMLLVGCSSPDPVIKDGRVPDIYNDILLPEPDSFISICGDGFCDPEKEDISNCWSDCHPILINPDPEIGPGPGHPNPGPYKR